MVMRIASCGVLLVVAGLLAAPTAASAQSGVLRVGLSSVPAEVDPATALDGPVALIARQVFDTLVQYVGTGSDVEPALAAQWSVSKDGLAWSFRLREGVSFSDGTPLVAQAVVESIERATFPGHPQAPAGDAGVARLFRGTPGVIRAIRARDTRTVEFTLSQPYAPLLTVLAHPALSVVMASAAGAGGGNRWQGTGPFSVAEMAAGRIVLEARPGHWSRGPRLARIVFTEVADGAPAEAALAGQGLDVVFPTGPPSRAAASLSLPSWRIGYLALEVEKAPLNRVKARRAIAAALDPAQLAPALGQVAVPLQSFLPRGVWGRREGPPLMGGDAERGKRLLAEAGLAPGVPVTLLLDDAETRIDRPRLAEAIRASLAAIGMSVTIRTEPAEQFRSLVQNGEHQMALAEARVDAGDPHFLLYPLSSSEGAVKGPSAVNLSFYRNSRLDDLLIRASQLFFRPERERLYARAQATLAEELPWIPLYVRLHWAMARPEVRDLRLHPSGSPRLDRVWVEGQPAARLSGAGVAAR